MIRSRAYTRQVDLSVAGLVAVVITFCLAGCTPAGTQSSRPTTPDTTVSVSPSPKATSPQSADPAAIVEIGPTEVALLDARGAQVSSLPYTASAADIVAMLNFAFGDSQSLPPLTDNCPIASWGVDEASIIVLATPHSATGINALVSTKTSHVGSIRIQATPGFAVGDDITSVVASIPPEQLGDVDGQAVWAPGQTSTSNSPAGGVVGWEVSNGKKIATGIWAPSQPTYELCG